MYVFDHADKIFNKYDLLRGDEKNREEMKRCSVNSNNVHVFCLVSFLDKRKRTLIIGRTAHA